MLGSGFMRRTKQDETKASKISFNLNCAILCASSSRPSLLMATTFRPCSALSRRAKSSVAGYGFDCAKMNWRN